MMYLRNTKGKARRKLDEASLHILGVKWEEFFDLIDDCYIELVKYRKNNQHHHIDFYIKDEYICTVCTCFSYYGLKDYIFDTMMMRSKQKSNAYCNRLYFGLD